MSKQSNLNNHANQLNPNNNEYWHSRGLDTNAGYNYNNYSNSNSNKNYTAHSNNNQNNKNNK